MTGNKNSSHVTQACESEEGVSSENITDEVQGVSDGHWRPPEACRSEMLLDAYYGSWNSQEQTVLNSTTEPW